MNKIILLLITSIIIALSSCSKDNFDEPDCTLKGNVVYEGNTIGIRNNGTQFELWQDGFGKSTAISLLIAQDGTFSASLFSGDYKLVRKSGGPWLAQSADTIFFKISKNTQLDVPVTPYFLISNHSYNVSNKSVVTTFQLDKIVENASLAKVKVFLGKYKILDDRANKDAAIEIDAIVGSNSVTVDIPENLATEKSLFIRLGVKSSLSDEYSFTQVESLTVN